MEFQLILAIILLVVGLLMAFVGRAIWEMLMSIIGGFIGWFIGFGLGIYYFGSESWLLAIILGFIGGFIGSWLFGKLVEVALALVAGALAAGLVYAMGLPNPGDGWLFAAIIVFVIVFALSYYYIDEVIGIITAMIGGIIAGFAAFILFGGRFVETSQGSWEASGGSWGLALAVGILIFLAGAAVQTFVWKDQEG